MKWGCWLLPLLEELEALSTVTIGVEEEEEAGDEEEGVC